VRVRPTLASPRKPQILCPQSEGPINRHLRCGTAMQSAIYYELFCNFYNMRRRRHTRWNFGSRGTKMRRSSAGRGSALLPQRRAYRNGEMSQSSPSYPTQSDGYESPQTHSDGRVSEDAGVRRATAQGDESVRRLAHELRNCIAPIVNVMHLIKLRGSQDPAL